MCPIFADKYLSCLQNKKNWVSRLRISLGKVAFLSFNFSSRISIFSPFLYWKHFLTNSTLGDIFYYYFWLSRFWGNVIVVGKCSSRRDTKTFPWQKQFHFFQENIRIFCIGFRQTTTNMVGVYFMRIVHFLWSVCVNVCLLCLCKKNTCWNVKKNLPLK